MARTPRLIGLCAFHAAAATLFVHRALGQDASETDRAALLAEIKQAWTAREVSIHSLSFTAQVERTVKGRGNKPQKDVGTPFYEPRPVNDRVLKSVDEFAFERGNYGMAEFNEVIAVDDPEQTLQQTSWMTFDGVENRNYTKVGGDSMGEIEPANEPGRVLFHINFAPMTLWRFPEAVFKQLNFNLDGASVEGRDIHVEGTVCKRMTIPRKKGGGTASLDVDPARQWAPIQFQTWSRDGALVTQMNIQYDDTAAIAGATPVSWNVVDYSGKADPDLRIAVRVTKWQTNAPVDKKLLQIEFPVGTRVSKSVDGKVGGKKEYYIQERDRLRPITEKEFGQPPPKAKERDKRGA